MSDECKHLFLTFFAEDRKLFFFCLQHRLAFLILS